MKPQPYPSLQNYGITFKQNCKDQRISLIHSMLDNHIHTYSVMLGPYLFPPIKVLRLNINSLSKQIQQQAVDTQKLGAYLFSDGYQVIRYTFYNRTQSLVNKVIKELCILKLLSAMEIGAKAYKPMGFDIIQFNNSIQYCRQICFPQKEKNSINIQKQLSKIKGIYLQHKYMKIVYSKSVQKNVVVYSQFPFMPYKKLTFNYNLQPYNNFYLKYVICKRTQKSLAQLQTLPFLQELTSHYQTYEIPIQLDQTLHHKKQYYQYLHYQFNAPYSQPQPPSQSYNNHIISNIGQFVNGHHHKQYTVQKIYNRINQIDNIVKYQCFNQELLLMYNSYIRAKLLYIKPYNSSYQHYTNMIQWLTQYTNRNNQQQVQYLVLVKRQLYEYKKYTYSCKLYQQLLSKLFNNHQTCHHTNPQYLSYQLNICQMVDAQDSDQQLHKLQSLVSTYNITNQQYYVPYTHLFNQQLSKLAIDKGGSYSSIFYEHYKVWIQENNNEYQQPEQQGIQCEYEYEHRCIVQGVVGVGRIRSISCIQVLALLKCCAQLQVQQMQVCYILVKLFKVIHQLQLIQQRYSLNVQILYIMQKYGSKDKIWPQLQQYCYAQLSPNISTLFYLLTIIFNRDNYQTYHQQIGNIRLQKLQSICYIYHIYLLLLKQTKIMTIVNESNKIMSGIQAISDGDDENGRLQQPFYLIKSLMIPYAKEILHNVGNKLKKQADVEHPIMVKKQIKEMLKKLQLTG